MEPVTGYEPVASELPTRCSATELHRQVDWWRDTESNCGSGRMRPQAPDHGPRDQTNCWWKRRESSPRPSSAHRIRITDTTDVLYRLIYTSVRAGSRT